MTTYCPRLIEVDLPIRRISAHARREKSIRHGHISTLHIWWARRPLAACRAVICAALWPDPADERCPRAFRVAASQALVVFAEQVRSNIDLLNLCSKESAERWMRTNEHTWVTADTIAGADLRYALLDFIADFANWDAATVPAYLETARTITQAAHEALGGEPGTRPLVVDPFAGGGAIPLEALRVGADAFASDLNPIPVLLNKVVLEYIPRHGKRLAEEVKRWGQWVKAQAEQELAEFYPKDPDGATPIAYLWARTITCEGPGCGAEVPLIRSLWLAKKGERSVALQLIPNPQQKCVDFAIIEKAKPKQVNDGTVRKGAATCPCCGYTTPVEAVRRQLSLRRGGTIDSLLYCKVVRNSNGDTEYRIPGDQEKKATTQANDTLNELQNLGVRVPDLDIPPDGALGLRVRKYGMTKWIDLFSTRQKLLILQYIKKIHDLPVQEIEPEIRSAIRILLGLTVSKMTSFSSSLCIWRNVRTCVAQTFGRQTLSMVWDYGEMNPFIGSAGDFGEGIEYLTELIQTNSISPYVEGQSYTADACLSPLPDDIADFYFSDPPYYDAIPYGHLSEFFLLWLEAMNIVQETDSEKMLAHM